VPQTYALLDLGLQDTGTGGATWALALRGAIKPGEEELALAWTIRAAPHLYRRADLATVAVATAPLSEADAAKRIYDASKPLKDAGIPALEALTTVARRRARAGDRADGQGRALRPADGTPRGPLPEALSTLRRHSPMGDDVSAGCAAGRPRARARHVAAGAASCARSGATAARRLGTQATARLDVVRGYLRFFAPAR
jgi:hypothetical protein